MKQSRWFNDTEVDIDSEDLSSVIAKIESAISSLKKDIEDKGYEMSKHSISIEGDNSSYGNGSYLSVNGYRYETDKEEQDREAADKLAKENNKRRKMRNRKN